MRVMRHGLQTVRGIYAIRFAMKRMYYILCFIQQFLFPILKCIKYPSIN